MHRYRFICTDKITGRTLKLCAEGKSEDLAAERLWDIGFLITASERCDWKDDETLEHMVDPDMWDVIHDVTKRRKVGKVFHAWQSQDPHNMLAVMNATCHAIDRHCLLFTLADVCNRERSRQPQLGMILELVCWQWTVERMVLSEACFSLEPKLFGERGLPVPEPMDRLRILMQDQYPLRAAQVCEMILDLPVKVDCYGWIEKQRDKNMAKA